MSGDMEKLVTALPEGTTKGAIRDNLEVVCFAIVLILFFKTFVGQQFVIPSASMRNTLMIGDHLLTNKFIFAVPQWEWEAKLFPMRKVERGDIIVFRYPQNRDMDYVKRCVAIPGDQLEVRQKRLYIKHPEDPVAKLVTGEWEHHRMTDDFIGVGNSERPFFKDPPEPGPWPENRVIGNNTLSSSQSVWAFLDPAVYSINRQGMSVPEGNFRDYLGPITLPEGYLFAMGDNRENSEDSRFWGFVPMDHLRGRPFIVWWSFREGGNDDTSATNASGPADIVKNFFDGARHFFTWTRWGRTGTLPH